MNIKRIVGGNDLFQLIDFPARGDATLDLVVTNHKLVSYYQKPIPLSPIGMSDHNCVLWNPKVHTRMKHQKKKKKKKKKGRSGFLAHFVILVYELLICGHRIRTDAQDNGTQDKVDLFYTMLDEATNECFPVKKSKPHVNDKPWLTDRIKNLILERQKAYNSNNQTWCKLRNQVQQEIKRVKVSYHANRIRNLQKTEPKKWHQQIKVVTNSSKTKLSLDIPGIDDSDIKGEANAINTKFAQVSEGLDPL